MSAPADANGDDRRQSSSAANNMKVRRRNRVITSCLECRRRKLKCDKMHPVCNNCLKASRDCVYLAPAHDPAARGKLNRFKDTMDSLGRELEKDAMISGPTASRSGATAGSPLSPNEDVDFARYRIAEEDHEIPEEERGLEPTPLALSDIAYEDEDDDGGPDDIAFRLGKVRVSERIGGYVRPVFSDEWAEIANVMLEAPGVTPVDDYDPTNTTYLNKQRARGTLHDPLVSHLVPGSGFLLFGTSLQEDHSIYEFLPSQELSDKLLEHYWEAVHPICPTLHRTTFERQYRRFWSEVSSGFEPPNSLQALVFSVLLFATVSLHPSTADSFLGHSKFDAIDTLRNGCENSLGRAHIIRATKFETLQAFVTYLSSLASRDVSRAHASLVSMAIRLAQCAGLHRDGTAYGLSPIEVHARRLVWFQLCRLDILTCSAVGPAAQIRVGDYDTKLPLHVNDKEFESLLPPKQDAARFTDMTMSRIVIESNEFIRELWADRVKVEKKQVTLMSVLRKIEDYRQLMQDRYVVLIDENTPNQAVALCILRMLVTKPHIDLLHRYVLSVPKELPERLRQIVWNSCIELGENSLMLDTNPAFKQWAWSSLIFHQYHVALLMLAEAVRYPAGPGIDRIWHCLDAAFEINPEWSRRKKVAQLSTAMTLQLDEHKKKRRTRLPTNIEQNLGQIRRQSVSPQSAREATPYISPPTMRSTSPTSTSGQNFSPGNAYLSADYGVGSGSSMYAPSSSSREASVQPPGFYIAPGQPPGQVQAQAQAQAQAQGPQQPQPRNQTGSSTPDFSLQHAFAAGTLPPTAQSSAISTFDAAGALGSEPLFADMDWEELGTLFPLDAGDGSVAAGVGAAAGGMRAAPAASTARQSVSSWSQSEQPPIAHFSLGPSTYLPAPPYVAFASAGQGQAAGMAGGFLNNKFM